jgi:hypothetical protein
MHGNVRQLHVLSYSWASSQGTQDLASVRVNLARILNLSHPQSVSRQDRHVDGEGTYEVCCRRDSTEETDQERESYQPERQPSESLYGKERRILSELGFDSVAVAYQSDTQESHSEICTGDNPESNGMHRSARDLLSRRCILLEGMFHANPVDQCRNQEGENSSTYRVRYVSTELEYQNREKGHTQTKTTKSNSNSEGAVLRCGVRSKQTITRDLD